MANMDPIPLRTLTVLLNYERITTDPRFKDQRLVASSAADPSVLQAARRQSPGLFANRPKTIVRETISQFEKFNDPSSTEPASTIFAVSPNASLEVQALSFAERESLYHEALGHDGCYKAIGLYQYFFDLCPPSQKLSIQVTNEEPVLVGVTPRSVVEFGILGPRLWSVSVVPSGPLTTITGNQEGEPHAVLGFGASGSKFVSTFVDMTSRQYGDVGKGLYGESYYFGPPDQYFTKLEKDICVELENRGTASYMNPSPDLAEEERLKACAERVWKRWQNREKEGWCAHCGKGGKLLRCSGCKKSPVWYCCKEHQVGGWKLHKYTCEKAKK